MHRRTSATKVDTVLRAPEKPTRTAGNSTKGQYPSRACTVTACIATGSLANHPQCTAEVQTGCQQIAVGERILLLRSAYCSK